MSSFQLKVINQIFEMQVRSKESGDTRLLERNFNRLAALFEEEGFVIQDPTGEAYSSSRTDCEGSIIGEPAAKMLITKTLKPVVYQKTGSTIQLLQKAVVMVQKK